MRRIMIAVVVVCLFVVGGLELRADPMQDAFNRAKANQAKKAAEDKARSDALKAKYDAERAAEKKAAADREAARNSPEAKERAAAIDEKCRKKQAAWDEIVKSFQEPSRIGYDPGSTQLRIVKACFGSSSIGWVDITDRIQYLVEGDNLEVPVSGAPLMLKVKTPCNSLRVQYMWEGKRYKAAFSQGSIAKITDGEAREINMFRETDKVVTKSADR